MSYIEKIKKLSVNQLIERISKGGNFRILRFRPDLEYSDILKIVKKADAEKDIEEIYPILFDSEDNFRFELYEYVGQESGSMYYYVKNDTAFIKKLNTLSMEDKKRLVDMDIRTYSLFYKSDELFKFTLESISNFRDIEYIFTKDNIVDVFKAISHKATRSDVDDIIDELYKKFGRLDVYTILGIVDALGYYPNEIKMERLDKEDICLIYDKCKKYPNLFKDIVYDDMGLQLIADGILKIDKEDLSRVYKGSVLIKILKNIDFNDILNDKELEDLLKGLVDKSSLYMSDIVYNKKINRNIVKEVQRYLLSKDTNIIYQWDKADLLLSSEEILEIIPDDYDDDDILKFL